jgi:hypothetical protein
MAEPRRPIVRRSWRSCCGYGKGFSWRTLSFSQRKEREENGKNAKRVSDIDPPCTAPRNKSLSNTAPAGLFFAFLQFLFASFALRTVNHDLHYRAARLLATVCLDRYPYNSATSASVKFTNRPRDVRAIRSSLRPSRGTPSRMSFENSAAE